MLKKLEDEVSLCQRLLQNVCIDKYTLQMPLILDKPPQKVVNGASSRAKRRDDSEVNTHDDDSAPQRSWFPRTNLVFYFEGNTAVIKLKAQNTVMSKVLQLSFEIGKVKMACDNSYSPMGIGGLEKIAADALIAAAEALKYDGEDDVADRLECEEENSTYLHPLRNYVGPVFVSFQRQLMITSVCNDLPSLALLSSTLHRSLFPSILVSPPSPKMILNYY